MKKIIFWLFILTTIPALVFLSLGIIRPEITCYSSIRVAATPEEAFRIFNDTASMKLWVRGLKSIENIEGQRDVTGSKWKLVMVLSGKKFEILETITIFEPYRRFACHLENEVMQSEVDIRFTPSLQGTIISSENSIKGRNMFWRSLFVLSTFYIRDQEQKMYEHLKLLIDQVQVPA